MTTKQRQYVAIDQKSFYASVECHERRLDPMTTNLVVADITRTDKTICLAVSPSLKSYGIPGRGRLFEVEQKVKEINAARRYKALGRTLKGESFDNVLLTSSPELALSYIIATPRMALYIEYGKRIYDIYLKYVAPEDIHVYSIDEVFIDVTDYLNTYQMTARELTAKMIQDILKYTGITAMAGIGTNLFLAKVAMDILAKHAIPDHDGVRIAELDEMSYRQQLWSHQPLTDFWRVGRGYARKLEENGMFTMGDIARCSIGKYNEHRNEDLLYKLFGINAELLIDHAWGYESCTMADIKGYKSKAKSLGSGQVLHEPYPFDKAKLIVREMTDLLVLDLVDKGLVTDQIVLTIGYDAENINTLFATQSYQGEITTDYYGRQVPKYAHGSANLHRYTSSTALIMDAVSTLFDRIADKNLLIRRVNISANHVAAETTLTNNHIVEQLDLFTDYEVQSRMEETEAKASAEERKVQQAVLQIKKKYGKNALIKGMNLAEGATTVSRNKQIGGHKA